MKSIAVINFKGGVGKTTMTWLLGRYLSEIKGKKVLLIDVDPQMSLTQTALLNMKYHKSVADWEKLEEEGVIFTISKLLEQYSNSGLSKFNARDLILELERNSLFLIPSTTDQYELPLKLSEPFGQKSSKFLTEFINYISKARQYQFDYILLDCPPSCTPLSYSALFFTNLYLVPVNTDIFCIRSTKALYKFIQSLKAKEIYNNTPKMCIFANRVGSKKDNMNDIDRNRYLQLQRFTSDYSEMMVFNKWFPERAAFANAFKEKELNETIITHLDQLWPEFEKIEVN